MHVLAGERSRYHVARSMRKAIPREQNQRPQIPPKPQPSPRPVRLSAQPESKAPAPRTFPTETPTGLYIDIDPDAPSSYQELTHDQSNGRTPAKQEFSQLKQGDRDKESQDDLNANEQSQNGSLTQGSQRQIPHLKLEIEAAQPVYENEDVGSEIPEPQSPGDYEYVSTRPSPLMMLPDNQGQGNEVYDYAENGVADEEVAQTPSIYENVEGSGSDVDRFGYLVVTNWNPQCNS